MIYTEKKIGEILSRFCVEPKCRKGPGQIKSQKIELFVKWSIDRGRKEISLKDDSNYIE
jgi:hypothetical protein